MRKEILFAIVAGAIFGLIIAFGVWRLNSTITPQEVTKTQDTSESTPTPEFSITIAGPEENQVIVEGPVTVTGATKPNVWVAISGENKDYVTRSKSDGGFEAEVDLAGGINQIVFSAFDQDGALTSDTLTLIYSTKFPLDKEDGGQEESTKSADTVRQKVQEKVKQAQNVPYAYLGTVTDIVEDTFQLKTSAGEIKQTETGEDTSYTNSIKDSEKIEFSDVAIGDFVAAMGFKNGNGVLKVERVLVTTPPEKPIRKTILGQVVEIKGKKVKIKANDTNIWELDFPARWEGPEIEELEEGQSIIVFGIPEENTLNIRTVFIATTKKKASPTPQETEE